MELGRKRILKPGTKPSVCVNKTKRDVSEKCQVKESFAEANIESIDAAIDALKAEMKDLQKQNMYLIISEEKYKLEIESLKKQLEESETQRINEEKLLTEIFSSIQARKTKRLRWTEGNIIQNPFQKK